MPHKHKRKRGDDTEIFDLPPSQKARPLPVASKNFAGSSANSKNKKKGRNKDDDAPRAFRRLMAVAKGKMPKSGLDDGTDRGKGGKETRTEEQSLKIRPGEDMRSFAARVDAALPVSGLTKKTAVKDGKDEIGFKVYRTRKERKMHKLYDQWRAEERKIQERKEDELEEAAERELDDENGGITATAQAELDEATSKRKKKKGGRGKQDDDPWLQLKKKRAEARVGLHDTAQAPPELNKKLSHRLQVEGAVVEVDNIPKAAGSLRRREELQKVRADVVDAYRKIREHEQAKLNKLNGIS